ncbi:major outer membrane protein [Sulfurospirillum arcachonense]|uniref:major outer membrane protein n=1 Tax=Sulfurospirillum arcachonense TaxID=57666 RepID=UPI00046881FC|nr:major outer membrane protein [Sulfurospirillum arcachonense]
MKLAKLSLAAIMAVGALSTANAQPLEEAIKGVDFSGFARYRFHDVERNDVNTKNNNDYDIGVKLVAPVTEDLKFTTEITAGGSDNESDYKVGGTARSHVDVDKMYFTYTKNALTVQAGRQALGTPVSDNGYRGQKGTGVLAMYNFGTVTLAGAYFNTSDLGTGYFGSTKTPNIYNQMDNSEINALAAIASFGPVNAQIWGIRAVDAVDYLVFAQVDGSVANFTFTGQVIQTELDDTLVGTAEDSGTFYGLKAEYKGSNFKVAAVFTDNDEDQGVHAVATDANNDVIAAGWRLADNDYKQVSSTGGQTYGLDGSITFGKIGLMAGFAEWDQDTNAGGNEEELTEIWGGVSYKYSKNFNTYIKYSDVDADNVDSLDQEYLRFEAKYTF